MRAIEGEVVSAEDRIRELEEEVSAYRGGGQPSGGYGALIQQFASNPGMLKSQLNLTDDQARNVKAALAGVGTGVAVKYLGKSVGDEFAAAIGGLAAAFLAKKLLGG